MQAQVPNIPLFLLGNPLTPFHPEPLSVLTLSLLGPPLSGGFPGGVASHLGPPSPPGS